jgi:hypothetical protein
MEDSSKCRQPSIMGERPNRADQPFPLPLPSRSSFILLCRSRCRCCCSSLLSPPPAAVVRDTPHHHSPPSCLSEVCFRSTLPTAMSKALFVATEVEFSRAPIIRILPNAIRSKVRLLLSLSALPCLLNVYHSHASPPCILCNSPNAKSHHMSATTMF